MHSLLSSVDIAFCMIAVYLYDVLSLKLVVSTGYSVQLIIYAVHWLFDDGAFSADSGKDTSFNERAFRTLWVIQSPLERKRWMIKTSTPSSLFQ